MLQSTDVYSLQPDNSDANAFQITTPGTMTGEWATGFEGMQAVAVELAFLGGAGGQSVRVLVRWSSSNA
jgi:hypothetical protein